MFERWTLSQKEFHQRCSNFNKHELSGKPDLSPSSTLPEPKVRVIFCSITTGSC